MTKELSAIEIANRAMDQSTEFVRTGSQRAKSGRFDELDRLKSVSKRVLRQAQGAVQAWAHWKAINECLAVPLTEGQQEALWGLESVRLALLRDALLTSYRLTDNADKDKETLTVIAKALHDPILREELVGPEWALSIGFGSDDVERSVRDVRRGVAENKAHADKIMSLVVPNWKTNVGDLSDMRLYDLRVKMGPVRNRILAHSLSVENIEHPTLNEVDAFVYQVFDLARKAAHLFLGSAPSRTSFDELAKDQADNIWKPVFRDVLSLSDGEDDMSPAK